MPVFEDFTFKSTTGKNNIHARICRPDSEPKCVVQIAHGIAEHISRYADFMSFLAANGIVAVGNDHLGHGSTIENPEDKGVFADDDGWKYAVDDMAALRDFVRKEYPDLPYVIFGHSMGSFLTRTFIIRYPDRYDGAIISGTGHQSPFMAFMGWFLANLEVKKGNGRKPGDSMNKIAFGSYCDKIADKRTEFDWLSRDNAVVDKYIEDPLCGFVASNSLFRDMMTGIRFIIKQSNIDKMDKDKPIYFMSGDADPVGDYGKGVEAAYKAFCKAGIKDVFMRLYPGGRHEMLNEINNDTVYADILTWIQEKIIK